MKRILVESSAINSIGYEPASELLEVEFAEGEVYVYAEVPNAEYLRLMNADSIGTYMNKVIKARYRYRKVL